MHHYVDGTLEHFKSAIKIHKNRHNKSISAPSLLYGFWKAVCGWDADERLLHRVGRKKKKRRCKRSCEEEEEV